MESQFPDDSGRLSLLPELCRVMRNDFSEDLKAAVSQASGSPSSFLRIEGRVCDSLESRPRQSDERTGDKLLLGYIDLRNCQPVPPSTWRTAESASKVPAEGSFPPTSSSNLPLSPESSVYADSGEKEASKRRKVVGGLRLQPAGFNVNQSAGFDVSSEDGSNSDLQTEQRAGYRQVHTHTRFPLRKPRKQSARPAVQPSPAEKLISGIWRQLHSGIRFTRPKSDHESNINIRGVVDRETFIALNTVCSKYYNLSQSSRSLEMILQAYWVDCYEARIDRIKFESPSKSATESRMQALREACSVLQWREKELRNKLSIWRGYKEIKEAGGWVSLVFASIGVYRICKYQTGFDESLITRLRKLRSSFEVAADTLHPEWRSLLEIIGQQSPQRYYGHPHDWVTTDSGIALKLSSTYSRVTPHFTYQLIDQSVIDREAFPVDDPRRMPGIDPHTCQDCKQLQSDDVQANRCVCFPTLYGNPRSPPPVQIFHTANGKNNGIVARSTYERGSAVGEFVGYITNGINGVDVMIGGVPGRQYQIYQGKMGNFTRFINHSCRPNSRFQRFCWLGVERIIIVSRGIQAGNEITSDYSDHYWESLDKTCLCGEPCCRYNNATSGMA